MVNHRALLTLLESDDEPSRGLYKFAVNELIENPKWITGLVQDETKEVALMHLASRSHRVAHLFQCLHPFLLIEPDPRMERLMFSQIEYLPSTRDRIITETATFLLEMLPSLLDVLEVPQVIELLVPALENCFLSPPPALHKLASVIAGCGNILEHLTSDESGGKAMIQWANLKIMKIEDSVTLKTWTQRLIDIVDSCAGKHGIYETVSRWRKLINLTKALFKLKAIIEGESQLRSQQYVREATSNLARLTLLEPDNKKMHVSGQQQTQASAISLEHNTQVLLEVFALRTPNSPSELRHVIKTLQGEKTLSILQDVTKTFPCKLCKQDLDLATVRTQFNFKEKINNDVAPVSNLGIDIFGKLIGDWKVLLSVQALKSVQSLSQSGKLSIFVN